MSESQKNPENDSFPETSLNNDVEQEQSDSSSESLSNGPDINLLQNELEKTRDQLLRALADAENTRRRAQKDREDASKYAVTSFARDMLDVSDNLRRALDALPEDSIKADPHLANLVDGILATERGLLQIFERNGIRKLEPMDEPFNANFHEVMFETPVPGKPGGMIIQLIEPGYLLKDRLLRPARVGVTKATGETPPQHKPIDESV